MEQLTRAELMKKALSPNSNMALVYEVVQPDYTIAMFSNGTYQSAENLLYKVDDAIYEPDFLRAVSASTRISIEHLNTPEYHFRLVSFAVSAAACSSMKIPGVKVLGASVTSAEAGVKNLILSYGMPSTAEVAYTKQAKNIAWRYRDGMSIEKKKTPVKDNKTVQEDIDGLAALELLADSITPDQDYSLI